MGDVDLLDSALAKGAALIAAVRPEQWTGRTPCPDYDVRELVDHIVGWLRAFEAAANGRPPVDAREYTASDPLEEFRAAAAGVVAGWRRGGVDRQVRLTGPEMPGQVVLDLTIIEFITHGCDLAVATGRSVPFSDAELRTAFDRAEASLLPQYRGAGQAFGEIVEVADDAPLPDRFLAFMGRKPPVR